MKKLSLALAAALTLAVPAFAHEYALGALKIGHPWSRPNPPGAPTAVGFLTVTNTGTAPDKLVGGSSPDVAKIEVHEMSMDGGVMKMRPVTGGLVIAPGKTVALQPGGYHLMLIGPNHAFKVGEHIPATLKFEHAGEIKVEFYVEGETPKTQSHDMPGMKDMH